MADVPLRITFFHDVLCAWCYALSPRLRTLKEEFGSRMAVEHRSFALAPTPERLERTFGSKAAAKREILEHWRRANENDDRHRIRADLMASRPFDYPYSMPGLMACKAAEFQRGPEGHWDIFDRIQEAHLTECEDITQEEVLVRCAADVGLDVGRFTRDFRSEEARLAVLRDLREADALGIHAVPTLLVNGRWVVQGAHPLRFLRVVLTDILEAGGPRVPLRELA